ncbi:ATP-dependent RecD-like DNA helicase [Mucilaginibacter angelicae]|uniref:ATP-dependent RecD-like DNA helicase n=1 Tax=Mucilaginibacter angelicae TaxID=869718 RepID=A0ABV6LAN4_9SPHI
MPVTLNTDQKAAFKAIQKFLDHPAADVFVLKGYAGTGKTFLMQHIAQWLQEKKKKFCMLAATGRAATVLRGKTGFSASTVHSELYNFEKIDGLDEETLAENAGSGMPGQMTMQFSTRPADAETTIYIVDEASMLSGALTEGNDFAVFGSGILLQDFFQVASKSKIIFVGDPCQLPPVGQIFSPALDTDWLAKQQRFPVSVKLSKIERNKGDNDILILAGAIRTMSESRERIKFPKLPASNLNNVKLHPSDDAMFSRYAANYKAAGPNHCLAIARSNKKVQMINRDMRRELFGSGYVPLQVGDVLLVTQNNYSVPLTNGDFVVVNELEETEQKLGMKFQKVLVTALASGKEFKMLLSLDTLESLKGNLTNEQSKALIIDFNNQMKAKGYPQISEQYQEAMRVDPYLNCLKVSYGYAVTCHKAQGGEWNNVYLFLDKSMYGASYYELCKWWYTAVTRAKDELNLVNDWWVS